MAEIQLSEFGGDTIVVHFGGETNRINAYTFAQSLIAFADTARAIHAVVNPEQEIEIWLEATGPGSFRSIVRRIIRGDGGIFSRGFEAVFWGIVAAVIYDHFIKSDPATTITINTNEVVIETGNERIVVPRNVYDAAQNAAKSDEVQRSIDKTILPLSADPRVKSFGLTPKMEDPRPAIEIPRERFPVIDDLSRAPLVEVQGSDKPRSETARLVILKAWLNHAKRKWSFEWNGVPISAPIIDKDFLDRLARREFLIGAGDALDVEISYVQRYAPSIGISVNDQNSFVVTRVIEHIPRSGD